MARRMQTGISSTVASGRPYNNIIRILIPIRDTSTPCVCVCVCIELVLRSRVSLFTPVPYILYDVCIRMRMGQSYRETRSR